MLRKTINKIDRLFKDAIRLFEWTLWVRILTVGWAIPFEFIGILISIATFYFYTFGIAGSEALLEGYNPIHYLITGLFIRSLVSIPLPSIHDSVNDLYRGFFGSGGVRMSLADYLMNLRMSIYSYIIANLISIYIRESIVAFLYIIIGSTFYGLILPTADKLLIVLIAIFMGSIASLGIGFIAASIIWFTGVMPIRSPAIWIMDILISLTSGTYFPVRLLPSWLQVISLMLPHFYCLKIVRSAFAMGDTGLPSAELITLSIYMLTSILLGLSIFHTTYRKRGKRGPPTPL
mgnify:CR=1 FL=1